MPRLGFPRRARLVKTDEFSSVFNFRKRISGQHFVIYYRFNQLGWPRLGLIVGKKVAPAAVSRNYMRRVLREFFRKQQSKLDNVDIVIRIQKPFTHHEYALIEDEFMNLSARLAENPGKWPTS